MPVGGNNFTSGELEPTTENCNRSLFKIPWIPKFRSPVTGRHSFSGDGLGRAAIFGRRISLRESSATGRRERTCLPRYLANGRTVAFSVGKSISLLNMSKSTPVALCQTCGELLGWLPDESGLVYRGNSGTGTQIIQVFDLVLKHSRPLVSGNGVHAVAVSPDGHKIAFSVRENGTSSRIFVARLNPGGQAEAWSPITPAGEWSDEPLWSDDGRTVYFHSNRDGFGCLWAQNETLDTSFRAVGAPRAVHHFHAATLTSSHLSEVGLAAAQAKGSLFLTLGSYEGNLWEINTTDAWNPSAPISYVCSRISLPRVGVNWL